MNLPCMNCKTEVEQDQGKFFAEVFLCSGCCEMATHFFNRLVRELNFLLTMAKESIRLALVQGKFSFPEGPSGEPSKRAVLEEILKLEEARQTHTKGASVHNPIMGSYTAVCTFAGCGGSRIFQQGMSAGLRPGDMVQPDPSNEEFGKCPRCKRYTLKITKAPEAPPPPPPVGFSKVPER